MDVILKRAADGTPITNIPQVVVHHSPDGFEWGYGGSGPADLALNILNLFIPPDGNTIKCYKGECSQKAWDLHQAFKWRFIARIPEDGGTISEGEIREFLKEHE